MRPMDPGFFPNMAAVPSVQTASTRSCERLLELKNSFTIAIMSITFVVSFRCLQKRNSLTSFWCTYRAKPRSWVQFETSVDPSSCKPIFSDFSLFAPPLFCRYLLTSLIRLWMVAFDKGFVLFLVLHLYRTLTWPFLWHVFSPGFDDMWHCSFVDP